MVFRLETAERERDAVDHRWMMLTRQPSLLPSFVRWWNYWRWFWQYFEGDRVEWVHATLEREREGFWSLVFDAAEDISGDMDRNWGEVNDEDQWDEREDLDEVISLRNVRSTIPIDETIVQQNLINECSVVRSFAHRLIYLERRREDAMPNNRRSRFSFSSVVSSDVEEKNVSQ